MARECTVTIEDALLEEAQAVLGTASVQEIVDAGIRELIRARRIQDAVEAIGAEDLVGITVEDLLAQRAKDRAPSDE